MSVEISTRFIEKDDIDEIVKIQQEKHQKVDEDFDVVTFENFVWKKKEILEKIRQYKSDSKGTNDVRGYVAVTTDKKKVVGGLLYELLPDGYEIQFLTCHPSVANKVRNEFLRLLERKATVSKTRRNILFYIPDGDWENLRFFQDNGFKVKFRPHPIEYDSWFCIKEYTYSDKIAKKKHKDDDDGDDDPLGNFALT